MTEYSIIRDNGKINQYGVVATDVDTKLSIALGWFETYEEADSAIVKITGKVRTKIL